MKVHEYMSQNKDVWSKLRVLRKIIASGESNVHAMTELERYLDSESTDITIESLSLLSATMPDFGTKDSAESAFFPKVVKCLGSQTPRVRMSAISCLYAYCNILDHYESFIDLLIQHGLENASEGICNGTMIFVNTFVTTRKKAAIWRLMNPIVRKFNQSPPISFYYTFYTLRNFHRVLGKEFLSRLKNTYPSACTLYENTLNNLMTPSSSGRPSGKKMKKRMVVIIAQLKSISFLNKSILEGVTDENEAVRYKSVRKIHTLFQNFNCDLEELGPHLENFFKFLGELLDDVTIKVRLLSLDIMAEIVEKINCDAVLHLYIIMRILYKAIACRQQFVKKQALQILQSLMHDVHPMAVIKELLLKIHQSPIIRVEIINRITTALLSFPLHCFEIEILFQEMAPFLEDFVLNVRQAAFECCVTLSYASVAKGRGFQELASNLVKIYGVNRDTANSLMKRVKSRSLPQCQSRGGFNEVSYPSFQQNVDSTMEEISNDSSLSVIYSELKDVIQETSTKRKSIFTINCTLPEIHDGENTQSIPIETIPVNDVHQTKKNFVANSTEFPSDPKFNVYPNTSNNIQAVRKEINCLQHLQAQERNEVQQEYRPSKNQRDYSTDTSTSTCSTGSIRPVNKSISKLKTHADGDVKYDRRHGNSVHRGTSTPESGSEELSECFKEVDGRLSALSLDDSHCGEIEYNEYQENTTPSYSGDSSSAILQSPSQTPEKYSYVANCEQGDGDCCVSIGEESTLKSTQISGCGDSAEKILIDDTPSQISQSTDNTEAIEDCSEFERGSDETICTVETLPPNRKNFNVLVIEQKSDRKNAFLYIEEVFDSNSEFGERPYNDNDVHIVVDYPYTSPESSFTEDKHEDSAWLKKYNVNRDGNWEEAEPEICPPSKEFITTVETVDNFIDNDNNYDVSDSRAGSFRDYVEGQQSDFPTYKYKNCKDKPELKPDNASKFSQTSNARSGNYKTKEQMKQNHSSLVCHENKERVKEEISVKKMARKKHKPTAEYMDPCHGQEKKGKARVSTNPIPVHGAALIKQNNELNLENCNVAKQVFQVSNHESREIILNKVGIAKHNRKQQKSSEPYSAETQDLNHTRVLRKEVNLDLKTNSEVPKELSDVSIENSKTYKIRKNPRFYDEKDDECIKSQHNSAKRENSGHLQIEKEATMDQESNERTSRNDIEDSFQLQQKSRPSNERRASHQWIQNIDFLNRSQKCPWSETFERRIKKQMPFAIGERDDFDDLKQILDTLREEDVIKCEEGMLKIIRVANFYPHMINEYQLNQIMITLIGLIKSLKPSVAGQAVLTIGHLFMILKRPFESKFKIVIRDLLQRSGSRTFAGAYNAVIKSIFYILKGLSPQKAVPAFISEGSNHPNKAVRETTAQFLSILVEKLGPSKSLSPPLSKLTITTAAAFAMDGSPLTRHCGKIIFSVLMSHPNFNEFEKKFLSEKVQHSISKILGRIRSEGVEKEILPIDVILKDYL